VNGYVVTGHPPPRAEGRVSHARAIAASFWKSGLGLLRRLWVAYLLASILILTGCTWPLPTGPEPTRSYQADENAIVYRVGTMSLPSLNPHFFPWGTGFFYPLYAADKAATAGGAIHLGRGHVYALGRLLVFLCALGAITLVYVLGRQLFDARTGKLAAVILAVLPGFVINSHYLKVDIPMTFLVLAAFVVAYKAIDTGRFRNVVFLGLLAGYATSTKYNAVTFLPAGMVAIAMAPELARRARSYVAYLGAAAGGFLIGTPYALLSFSEFHGYLENARQINAQGASYVLSRPAGWIDYPLHVLPFSLTLPMLLATAAALVWAAVHGKRRLWPIWVFVLLFFVGLGADNFRYVRYTVPLLPFLALFLAYGLTSLLEVRAVRRFAVPATVVLIGYAFLFSLSYVRAFAETDPRIQASEWFQKHVPRKTRVAVSATHYLDVPQLASYRNRQVGLSVSKLRSAGAPYLVQSDFGTILFQQALSHLPAKRRFFDYVRAHYVEVTHFENSQRLLFINSKPRDAKLAQDWLHPNPRITILKRRRPQT
jgi:dolichyl-phosphate-mannose-protein mannosyltransferase